MQHRLRPHLGSQQLQRRRRVVLGKVQQRNGLGRQADLQPGQCLGLNSPLVGTSQVLALGPAGQHDQLCLALALA